MKNKISLADELAESMQNTLADKVDVSSDMEQAVEHLNSAADLFEDANMSFASEYITTLLEKIAEKDDKPKAGIWHLQHKQNSNATSSFSGTKKELDEHLEAVGDKYKIYGPYDTFLDLEKKHFPHFFEKSHDGKVRIGGQ